jgi:large subunit ribosomal protein L33
MAKDGPRIKILLRSTADTGFTYASSKNRRTTTTKVELRKYDPVVRRHVVFREIKA